MKHPIARSRNIQYGEDAMKRMSAKAMLVLFCWSLLTASAWAHKVNVFAWVEGDTVYTESKFSGGRMVKEGRITVLDTGGIVLVEGVTDDSGAFAFKVPKVADLTIVLEAGTGHRNTWKITATELEGGPPGPLKDAAAVSGEGTPEPSGGETLHVASGLSAHEVEEVVARQLEEKLRPLNRMMAESRDRGATLSDIVGGVGYILGLVGLGAYIRYRKERGKP
jgi:nickel transport protein